MHQTLNTFFNLGKATVISEVGYPCVDPTALWVSVGDLHPGVLAQLLEPQGHAVTLAVEFENLDVHLLPDFNNLAGMLDSLPRHIGDVQQSINTAQVDKGAVVGEVFDHALDGHAFLQVLQQFFALLAVGCFHHSAS